MSFSYNPLGANSMTPIMPILGNVANATNFLPQLASTAMQQIPGPSIMQSMAGLNDSPLEFNFKKNQLPGAGPMELETEREREKRDLRQRLNKSSEEHDQVLDRHSDDVTSPLDSPTKNVTTINSTFGQNELLYNSMMGLPQSLMMMPTSMLNMMDPSSMMSIQQFPLIGQINASLQQQTRTENGVAVVLGVKEMIKCKSCTLQPPNPNSPPATTRERPPGCRTVFVGGLPANATEEIIREIFERCGEITTLRLSKKFFCHIRFTYESSVDSAIFLSGYSIRIGNNADSPNSGRLHVDFAQARDDQYEWECKQRQLQREQRHRERIERDRKRNLSPPPIIHFTDHEAAILSEKLKQDEQFAKAVQILITWLERGDCNKKNSNAFYSMIQSSNSHVRRLQTEKTTYEEELDKAKKMYKKQMQCMTVQYNKLITWLQCSNQHLLKLDQMLDHQA